MSKYAFRSRKILALFTFVVGFAFPAATGAEARVSESYGQLPLHFEANRGQTHQDVRFLSRGPDYTLYLTAGEAVLVLARPNPEGKRDSRKMQARPDGHAQMPVVLRMAIMDADPKTLVSGLEELPGKANYFIGSDPAQWRTNVPTYAKVHYRDVYPGIDLLYYGNQRQLEYDFVVAPGADPNKIALGFQGADRLEIDAQGDLVLHAAGSAIRQRKPFIYQEIDRVRREIAGAYILKSAYQVGFQVAAYDASRPLVIDPTLFYSTYLGGSGDDRGDGIAVDDTGNAYVTGATRSTNFPTTPGAFQPAFAGGGLDAFVTKLNPTGTGLVYSTYLGGNAAESGLSIAVDAAFNAYVTGATSSSNFPTTPGAFQTTLGSAQDGFVTKLDPTGSTLLYSTYFGGSNTQQPSDIAVDTTLNAYVTGNTNSTDFPVTPGAFQTTYGGGTADAFLTKFNSTGSALVYSTYLGGSDSDNGEKIALDAAFNAYVAGWTGSSNFPVTAGAFQTTFGGGGGPGFCCPSDAFVTKLNPTGTALVYSTYLGGSGNDVAHDIALDAAFNVYVVGETSSSNFPTTAGAFQPTFGGFRDAFVTKMNPTGTAPLYSTYLGGDADDVGEEIAVDATFNAYVVGWTSSSNFPTLNAIQATNAGGFDAFVTKVDPLGTGLVWSTYLGGSGGDFGLGIALDNLPSPNTYVTGLTSSTNFPTTPLAFQTANAGSQDVFVAKIVDVVLPPTPTVGKVTGGGTINVAGGFGNFGFIVQHQADDSSIHGHLQYVNHATKAKVHSEMFTMFAVGGNTATFGGTCTNNGAPCTFTVEVMDNGEPGVNDTFTISITAGPTDGGTLRGGNIQIHQ